MWRLKAALQIFIGDVSSLSLSSDLSWTSITLKKSSVLHINQERKYIRNEGRQWRGGKREKRMNVSKGGGNEKEGEWSCEEKNEEVIKREMITIANLISNLLPCVFYKNGLHPWSLRDRSLHHLINFTFMLIVVKIKASGF